jgi:hypothetical protein
MIMRTCGRWWQMVADGCRWVQMGADGCRWVQMGNEWVASGWQWYGTYGNGITMVWHVWQWYGNDMAHMAMV